VGHLLAQRGYASAAELIGQPARGPDAYRTPLTSRYVISARFRPILGVAVVSAEFRADMA
jgi:hypothetical protein